MLTIESGDKDILDFPIANKTVRDIGSITFLGWVANRLNNVQAYKADTQELLRYVSNPPIGKIPDEEKVRIVRKLLKLGVTI